MTRRGERSPTSLPIVALLACLAAGAAPGLQRREKPVELPALEVESVAAIRLDADIYALSSDDLADLRVLDAAGSEVPYVVRTATTETRRTVRRVERTERPTVRPLEDDGLEIVVAIDPRVHPVTPAGFTLVTPRENFENRVSVAWSPEGENWVPLVENALVYDYTQFIDVRNVDIRLPAEPARPSGGRYRIVIGDVTQEQELQLLGLTRTLAGQTEVERRERTFIERQPFRIDRIDVWHDEERLERSSPILVDRPPAAFEVDRDGRAQTTRIVVETLREPLTELAIETTDRNFSRRAVVDRPVVGTRGAASRELRIASGTLTKIDIAGVRRHELAIPFPETRSFSYTISIDDGDSPPIGVTGVAARGPAQEVVFLARPGTAYRLAYGGELRGPRYDTAAITAALGEGVTPKAGGLGPESPAAAAPAARDVARLLTDTRVQVGVIAFLVLVLAFALFRAAKRIDATTE